MARKKAPQPATRADSALDLERKAAEIATAKMGIRADSWRNVYTGASIPGVDKFTASNYQQRDKLTYNEETALYRQNWLAKRQVDDVCEDATRSGFTFVCQDDPELADKVYEYWKEINAIQHCKEGMRWALVYGGAVGMLLTDDEALNNDAISVMSTPLDPSQMGGVRQIVICNAIYAVPNLTDMTVEAGSPNFGNPTLYTVTPYGYSTNTPSFQVHWTRILRFEGVPVDQMTRIGNLTWGDSIYESSYDALMRYGMVYQGASLAAAEFGLKVLKVNGLSRLMATEQYEQILGRAAGVKLGLGAARMAIIDNGEPGQAGEELVLMSQPVTGLPDLMDRSKQEVAGALHSNLARLFGESEGALSTADQDDETWQEWIHGWQMSSVIPQLTRLTQMAFESKDGPHPASPDKHWEIIPNPIDPPDTSKELEQKERQSKVDQVYYAMGALEPSEIRESRFGGARFSHETVLDPAVSKTIKANDEAAAKAASTPTTPEVPDDVSRGAVAE